MAVILLLVDNTSDTIAAMSDRPVTGLLWQTRFSKSKAARVEYVEIPWWMQFVGDGKFMREVTKRTGLRWDMNRYVDLLMLPID